MVQDSTSKKNENFNVYFQSTNKPANFANKKQNAYIFLQNMQSLDAMYDVHALNNFILKSCIALHVQRNCKQGIYKHLR